ncbi:MAG TPA: AAA family ATPase [Gaiellales bacterium]|jgi:pilus assembly protein CpaE
MEGTIRALVAVDPAIDRGAVKAAMPMDDEVEVVAMVDGYGGVREASLRNRTDLLIVACGPDSDGAVLLVEESRRQYPDRPVLVLCTGSPNGFVRRAFAAGADDIATLPLTPDQLRFMIDKAITRRDVPGEGTDGVPPAAKRMIVVLGPKGGTGKTLTACNLGVKLAQTGASAVLVDLDLQFGDVGLSLGMKPDRTIFDLATAAGTIDGDKVEGYLSTHRSGLRVLLAPGRPDQASAVTVEFLSEMYRALRERHQYVIVDTPPGFTPEVIASIDVSSDVALVGMLDTLSLKNTRLGLETLDLMGYPQDQVSLVLNRADSRVGITHADVATIVGREPGIFIPSDREIPKAVNEGEPIVLAKPKSEAAAVFAKLAAIYQPDVVSTQTTTDGGSDGRRLLRRKG